MGKIQTQISLVIPGDLMFFLLVLILVHISSEKATRATNLPTRSGYCTFYLHSAIVTILLNDSVKGSG